jgi:hypothetical protein
MNLARRDMEQAAAVESADRSQAAYFRGLLAEHRAEIDQTIAEYHAAMEGQTTRGELPAIAELSRRIHRAQHERAAIDRMISHLDRRFPLTGPPAAVPKPPPAETVHPDGRSLVSLTRRHRQTRVG